MTASRSTWTTRERPVLEAIADMTAVAPFVHNSTMIVKATGLSLTEVGIAIDRLVQADYVHANRPIRAGTEALHTGVRLLERGLREVEIWPSEDIGQTVVVILDERIALTDDPEERSKLEQLRDAAVGVGTSVLTGVLTEGVKRAALG